METVIEACRLCAKLYANPKELEFVHLFEPYKGLENVAQFILQQLRNWQIEVNVGDGLPPRICASCFDRFSDINIFRQECIQAQQTILHYYVDLKEQVINNYHNNNNIVDNGGGRGRGVGDVVGDGLLSQVNANSNERQEENGQTHDSFSLSLTENNDMLPQGGLDFSNTISNNQDENLDLGLRANDHLDLEAMDFLSSLTSDDIFLNNPLAMEELENVIKSESFNNELDKLNDDQDFEKILQENVIKKNSSNNKNALIPYENNNSLIVPNAMENKMEHEIQQQQQLRIQQQEQEQQQREEQERQHQQEEQSELELQQNTEQSSANIEEEIKEYLNENEDETDNSPKCIQSGVPLACQYCYCHGRDFVENLIYPNDEALSQHYFDVHDPNLPYNCPFCSESFKAPKQRDYHVQKQHYSLLPPTECEYCHRKISTTIEIHQFTCSFIGNWFCKVCNENFTNTALSRFRAHQRMHEASKQYRCRVCNRDFVRRANLEAHERTHQLDHVVMIRCGNCGETFPSEYELKRHKYQFHGGKLPVKCEHCLKSFASLAFLNRHIINFHPEKINNNHYKDTNKTCKNCGLVFQSVQKLRSHLQRPKDENGNCIITSPNSKYDLSESPTKDKAREKYQQGLFQCRECAKRFYLKSQLAKHLNTHEACLKPYSCNDCNVRCRSNYELQEHINIAHLSLKPFECQTCGKRFAYKKDLLSHELFHTDLIIKCKEIDCSFECKNDKSLNDHMRLKHPLNQCDYCGVALPTQKLLIHLRIAHSHQICDDLAEMHSFNEGNNPPQLNDLDIANHEDNDITTVLTANTTIHTDATNLDLISNPVSEANHYFVDSLMDLDSEIIIK